MKRIFGLIAIVCAMASGADAASFQWDVQPANGAQIEISMINFEVVIDGPTGLPQATLADPGDQIFGIFVINAISDPTLGTNYWTPKANQQLAGTFSGYTALDAVTVAGGVQHFTGGVTQVWFDDTPDFTATLGPLALGWAGAAASNGVGNAGDVLMLTANGVQGVDVSPLTTLQATFTTLASSTAFTGVADGFLDIISQLPFDNIVFVQDAFDAQAFPVGFPTPGDQDLSLKNNFTAPPNAPVNGWSIQSRDPILAQVQVVPEPSSLALLTLGGLGLAGIARRRRNGKAAA